MNRREMLLQLSALALASRLKSGHVRGDESTRQDVDLSMRPLVRGNTEFACDLYQRLRADSGNLFFSPYSISMALAMTTAGAAGETARQIDETLHFPDNVHPAAAELIRRLQGESDARHYELSVVNSLWGQRGFAFLPDFLNRLAASYASELRQVDFASAAEQARRDINRWVEGQTNERIRDLLQPGMLDSLTTLVLVNAIYFKAAWRTQFQERLTTEGLFRVSAEQTVAVPLMAQQNRFRHGAGEGYAALELPYEDDELSMLLLLPDEVDGLPELEAALDSRLLAQILAGLKPRQVRVELPRFSASSTFNLAATLGQMGMPDAFVLGTADFSGITVQEPLAISHVVHKAFVDVDEAGTEAAAATAVVFLRGSAPRAEIHFRVDRPFLFLIRDHGTGSVLFMGRVTNPAQVEA